MRTRPRGQAFGFFEFSHWRFPLLSIHLFQSKPKAWEREPVRGLSLWFSLTGRVDGGQEIIQRFPGIVTLGQSSQEIGRGFPVNELCPGVTIDRRWKVARARAKERPKGRAVSRLLTSGSPDPGPSVQQKLTPGSTPGTQGSWATRSPGQRPAKNRVPVSGPGPEVRSWQP